MLKTTLKRAMAATVTIFLTATLAWAEEAIEFKMQLSTPDGTVWNEAERRFVGHLVDATDGRASATLFPPGSVSKFPALLQSAGSGLLDIVNVWHPLSPGKFLPTELFALPGISRNQVIDSVVYMRLRETYPQMGELFTEQDNVVELASFVAAGAHLHTINPVRTLDDLKGKVFAAQNAAGARTLEALGASASVMVGSDVYLALQRGSIDGVLAAWGWVNNFKFIEVTEYHTMIGLSPGSYSYVMNRDTWNALTEAEQAHVHAIMPIYMMNVAADSGAKVLAEIPPENVFTLSENDRAELMKKMEPLWVEWVEKANAKGWPGQEILDEAVRLSELHNRI